MLGDMRDCYNIAVQTKEIHRQRRDRLCSDEEDVAAMSFVEECQESRRRAAESVLFNAVVELAARYSLCGKEGCKEVLGDMTR